MSSATSHSYLRILLDYNSAQSVNLRTSSNRLAPPREILIFVISHIAVLG
jgi:hypothetical protein